jgi:hypothetical protein
MAEGYWFQGPMGGECDKARITWTGIRPSYLQKIDTDIPSARHLSIVNSVLRIRNVYPGSRIQGQKDSGSRIRVNEFKYF